MTVRGWHRAGTSLVTHERGGGRVLLLLWHEGKARAQWGTPSPAVTPLSPPPAEDFAVGSPKPSLGVCRRKGPSRSS